MNIGLTFISSHKHESNGMIVLLWMWKFSVNIMSMLYTELVALPSSGQKKEIDCRFKVIRFVIINCAQLQKKCAIWSQPDESN